MVVVVVEGMVGPAYSAVEEAVVFHIVVVGEDNVAVGRESARREPLAGVHDAVSDASSGGRGQRDESRLFRTNVA